MMSKSIALPSYRRYNQRTIRLNIIFLLSLAVSGFIYLVFTNRLALLNHSLRDMEKRFSILKEVSQKMEIELAELSSIEEIKQQAKILGLVPAAKINYIKTNNGVAINR